MYIQWEVLYIYNIVFLIVYYRAAGFGEEAVSGAAVVPMPEVAYRKKTGTMASTEPAIRIRHNFPETWLWQMLETGQAV